jgi:uncharacterized Tic20 family protein
VWNKHKISWKARCFDLRGKSTEAFLIESIILTVVVVVVVVVAAVAAVAVAVVLPVVVVVVMMGDMIGNCGKTSEMPLAVPFLITRPDITISSSVITVNSSEKIPL